VVATGGGLPAAAGAPPLRRMVSGAAARAAPSCAGLAPSRWPYPHSTTTRSGC